MHGTAQRIANLGVRSLLELASWGPSYTFPVVSPVAFITCFSFIFGDVLALGISNDQVAWIYICEFIFNLVIADSGKLEIGTRQYNNWRLHEPPDFLSLCQPGALSTRLYCSRMPRHHTRPPGRYTLESYDVLASNCLANGDALNGLEILILLSYSPCVGHINSNVILVYFFFLHNSL